MALEQEGGEFFAAGDEGAAVEPEPEQEGGGEFIAVGADDGAAPEPEAEAGVAVAGEMVAPVDPAEPQVQTVDVDGVAVPLSIFENFGPEFSACMQKAFGMPPPGVFTTLAGTITAAKWLLTMVEQWGKQATIQEAVAAAGGAAAAPWIPEVIAIAGGVVAATYLTTVLTCMVSAGIWPHAWSLPDS